MPQVMQVPTAEEKRAATAAAAAAQRNTGKRGYKPPGKKGMISTSGIGITMIILCVLVIGGAGFAVGGYFVFKAIKGHMDKRNELTTTQYTFEKESPPPAEIAKPKSEVAWGGGSTSAAGVYSLDDAGKPTRSDLEKLQKSFQAMMEISMRLEEDYKEDLTEVGLNRLLLAERIAADKDFKQSRQIIGAARQVIEKHKKIAQEEDEAFLKDLGKLSLEGIATEMMVMRIRGIMHASQPNLDKLRGIDTTIAGHYEQAINHLEATQGTWKLEGESVVFSKDTDAERYKTFFDEVDKCVQMQADLAQKIGIEAVPKWKAAFGL